MEFTTTDLLVIIGALVLLAAIAYMRRRQYLREYYSNKQMKEKYPEDHR